VWAQRTHCGQQIDPAQIGQLDLDDNQREGLEQNRGESLLKTGRADRAVFPHILQQIDHALADVLVLADDENGMLLLRDVFLFQYGHLAPVHRL